MDKLPIRPRQADETEEEFQRRYSREKMRLYRAREPKQPPKPRGKNTRPPKNSPLSHDEWLAAQQQPGESDDDYRKRGSRERVARYRERHAERLHVERLAHYAANKEQIASEVAARKARNPEVYRATQRRHFERNREAKIAKLKEWGQKNPERLAKAQQRWNDANRDILASYSAKWRKCCRIATPPWADFDLIRAFYTEAKRLEVLTGIKHEVDHIIPIRGRGVCGLHVHTNLRVIPKIENSRKHNKLDERLVHITMMADIDVI